MGGLCSKPEVAPETLPPQPPLSLDNKALYISAVNDILNMSKDALDSTYIPKGRSFGKNSLILTIGAHFDPKLFVRFYLINNFYIQRYSNKYPQNKTQKPVQKPKKEEYEAIFYKLVAKTHPEPEEQMKIQQFKKAYQQQKNQARQTQIFIDYLLKAKFIIENLNNILLHSDDPKDIGHLTFPIARLFEGIGALYRTNRHTSKNPIYIVAVVEDEEKDFIAKMKGKNCCFAFSIFMRGFTVEANARKKFSNLQKQYKNSKTVLFFTVNFPYTVDKIDTRFDYGFYVVPDASVKEEGDVVFNLFNTFKVVDSFSKTEYDLQYGYLSALYYADRVERIKKKYPNAIRVFDICSAVSSHYLKSQSCLFRIIKSRDQSLKVSQSIISQPTTTNNKDLTQLEAENLVNNYIDEELFDQALKLIDKYRNSNLMKAKKLEIMYKRGKIEEAKKLIAQIPQKTNPINQATQIRNYIEARIAMKQDKNLSLSKFRALTDQMKMKYAESFEVIGNAVIASMEEVTGGEGTQAQKELYLSQVENKAAIKQSAINLRGISTTI